jgi:hypothetical protein
MGSTITQQGMRSQLILQNNAVNALEGNCFCLAPFAIALGQITRMLHLETSGRSKVNCVPII